MGKYGGLFIDYNVLVLGNGFDLHLKLKSSFSDFFKEEVLDEKSNFKSQEKNLLLFLLFLRFYYRGRSTKTFYRTIYEDDPSWMDVEGFIKELATEPQMLDNIHRAMSFRVSGVNYSLNTDPFLIIIGSFLAKLDLPKDNYDKNTLKNLLADNLTDFEKRFSTFLKKQLNLRENYHLEQEQFVDHIISSLDQVHTGYQLQVINFNYTGGLPSDYHEANVHGKINKKVVIGYDSTQDAVTNDDIFELSKDWRKIDIDFKSPAFSNNINSIIFYGHSLGEQDYPYFFELFDKCDLINSNYTRLFFCFSLWDESDGRKKSLEHYQMNASKLLNAYERYHNPTLSKNTIVTKLKTQQRLLFKEIK